MALECDDIRESILVDENVVMCRTAGTEQAAVTLQIKVEFDGIHNVAVDDCASGAISAPISLVFRAREEANMVALADNNKCYGGFKSQ